MIVLDGVLPPWAPSAPRARPRRSLAFNCFRTSLTNEEIVAELGWTKQIIKDVTGVTPNTMRPPYGDIDDRVRYISLQMGLTPIIWTAADGGTFDTQDWQVSQSKRPTPVTNEAKLGFWC